MVAGKKRACTSGYSATTASGWPLVTTGGIIAESVDVQERPDMKLSKGPAILWERLTRQGVWVTVLWAADHATRILTGAPLRRVSQITANMHVGGQYRRRGWSRMEARGVTAVINMRTEFDDKQVGIAPERYLHLPTVDDHAPSLGQLAEGTAFIASEIGRDGQVYIHCGSGVGRAPTMAAAYLISTGLPTHEAWAMIRRVRPFIRPTAAQVEQLDRFAAQI